MRRRYLPDFIVDLTTGERLIVEIKGLAGDADIKTQAAHRWCTAVNNDGRFGRWSYHIVRQPPELMKLLDKLLANRDSSFGDLIRTEADFALEPVDQ